MERLFADGVIDVQAGLRPNLTGPAAPPGRTLPGRFMAVQQAVGTHRGSGAEAYLDAFVANAKAVGLIKQLIDENDVAEKLTVAP